MSEEQNIYNMALEENNKKDTSDKEKNIEENNKNKKGFNAFFDKYKFPMFFLFLIIVAILGTFLFNSNKKKLEASYTYNEFTKDLLENRIEYVGAVVGSKSAKIRIKKEEQIKKEKEFENKIKEEKDEKRKNQIEKEYKEYIKFNKEKLLKKDYFSKLSKTEKEEISKRSKEIIIPANTSFVEMLQKNIENGKTFVYEVKDVSTIVQIFKLLMSILPTLLIGVLIYVTIEMQGLNKKGKVYDDEAREETGIKFSDVAGLNEEKEELIEIVDFLKNPAKYKKMGAKIPKGVLLYGKPGTGKTLVVKAIAGEAKVPFISMSGSEFVEMFAGLGASRVRKLFERARKISPCIIFIDEIDAIGSMRSGNGGGSDTENNQTLNQLLVEMDGFSSSDNIIVIAATNRPEILDKALLRPGRFDRRISIPTPDIKGREEILKLHARNKNIDENINFREFAAETAGFTGADLANILNEAAIFATRHNKEKIEASDLNEALKKVTVGLEKQNRVISKIDRKITAYHEAGHAVVSRFLPTQEDVKEVSIIPRGMAGGYTMYKTSEDKSYISKTELYEKIVGLMGGRAAEELIIGDISTGASNDFEVATDIAKAMVVKYGMSKKIGVVSIEQDIREVNYFGEQVIKDTGEEIRAIVNRAYNEAVKILKANLDGLHRVAGVLLEKEKITGEEFKNIFEEK